MTQKNNKILGTIEKGQFVDAKIKVHSTCTRVFVEKVHTEAVHLGTEIPHEIDDVKNILTNYRSEVQKLKLPSAAQQPIIVVEDPSMPQPLRHGDYPAMITMVGRLRGNDIFTNGLSYILTSNNLEKGAGGGAVLSAEYLHAKKYF